MNTIDILKELFQMGDSALSPNRSHGTAQGGCTDTAAPEYYTPEQLSRVKDAVDLCKYIDTYCNVGTFKAFWDALPYPLKMEFNFSKWDYVPKKEKR